MTRIWLILFCFVMVSCIYRNHKGFNYPSTGELIDSSFYFPKQYKMDFKDSIVLTSTSEYFRKLGLENLSIKPHKDEVYRFSYVRAFHEPVIICIYKDSIIVTKDYSGTEILFDYDFTKISISENELLGYWGNFKCNEAIIDKMIQDSIKKKVNNSTFSIAYKRGKIDSLLKKYPAIADTSYMKKLDNKVRVEKIVTHKAKTVNIKNDYNNYKLLLASIDKYEYWKMKNTNNVLGGCDGSEWILEANTKNGYYFVYSWEPEGDFKKLCLEFLKYSDLKDEEIY
jgi:hypothetical protein